MFWKYRPPRQRIIANNRRHSCATRSATTKSNTLAAILLGVRCYNLHSVVLRCSESEGVQYEGSCSCHEQKMLKTSENCGEQSDVGINSQHCYALNESITDRLVLVAILFRYLFFTFDTLSTALMKKRRPILDSMTIWESILLISNRRCGCLNTSHTSGAISYVQCTLFAYNYFYHTFPTMNKKDITHY